MDKRRLITHTQTFQEMSRKQQWLVMRHTCRPMDMYFYALKQGQATVDRYSVICRPCGEWLVMFGIITNKQHPFHENSHG